MAQKPTVKKFEIKDNVLILRYPIAPVRSNSGKSILLASSRGRDSFEHEGKTLYVNLNVYTPVDDS